MRRFAAWWFADAPSERLAAMRILIGLFALVYTAARIPELAGVARYSASQFRAIGVVRLLGHPLAPGVAIAIAIVTCMLLAAFVAGWRYRVVAPLAAMALLWTLSYRNTWGQIFHTENLLVLHVLALACAPAADAWAMGDTRPASGASAGYGWPIKLLAALTVATYLLAGVAKLRLAGLAWVDGEMLRNQIAVDNLRKALFGDRLAPLATLFLDHPSPLVVFSVGTLVIELGAPIAMVGGRVGRWWSLAAWGFHLGVVLMMNIWFLYPLAGMAFLPFVRAERVIEAARGIAGRWRR